MEKQIFENLKEAAAKALGLGVALQAYEQPWEAHARAAWPS